MRTVVGVLRGGPSSEYEVSLKSGASVLEHIDRERYDPRDIFIDRNGEWHVHGLAVPPQKALHGIDVAFNALHDSQVGRVLESMGVPHTGPDALSSGLAADPYRLRLVVRQAGLRVPHSVLVARGEPEAVAHRLFRSFPQPSRVNGRPAGHFGDFYAHLAGAFEQAEHAHVEEHIAGRPAVVGVIRHFRNEPIYTLIPSPIDLPSPQKTELVQLAKRAHEALGLGYYAQMEFVVSRRGPYFVGVSAHPPLHGESGFAGSLKAVGSSLKEFISHVIDLAKRR